MTLPAWTRQRVAALVAAALVLVLGAGLYAVLRPSSRSADSCPLAASLQPSCGVLWGAALDSTNSHLTAAVAARQQSTGRRLDIVHTYHRWYDSFPTAGEKQLSAAGNLLFINWEPVDAAGKAMSWSAIAAGAHDAEITALGHRLAALGKPVLISFSHEPEADYPAHGGSAVAFVAAFRHVHDLVVHAGATKVRWVWNTMGLADPVWRARYASLYPGNAYVDWIAWDPYNWATCRDRAWQSFAQIATPFYSWLESAGFGNKPFMLAEYGSVEQAGNPGGKAAWLAGIPSALTALPNLKALVYFDLPAPPANCDWQVSTSAAATTAYQNLAKAKPFSAIGKTRLP